MNLFNMDENGINEEGFSEAFNNIEINKRRKFNKVLDLEINNFSKNKSKVNSIFQSFR